MKNFTLTVAIAVGILATTQLSAAGSDSMNADPLLIESFIAQLSTVDIDTTKADHLRIEPFTTSPICQIDPAFNKFGA
jgi:hypothetical protein